MAAKKADKQDALIADLTKQVKKQRSKLKKLKTRNSELEEKVERHRAKAKAAKRKYRAISDRAIKDHDDQPAAPIPGPDTPLAGEASSTPDASWTVAQLRAEAKTRGVAGYSRLNKAALVAALS